MEKKQNTAQEWLEIATRGIRFKPDRLAVEAELREHLEDKTADMARIFHIEGGEAEREALKRMGDPEEIGKKLAKIHKPWLGYLWMASRVVRFILLAFALFSLLRMSTDYHGNSVMRLSSSRYYPPAAAEPAQVKLGGYTFRIVSVHRSINTPYTVNTNGTVSAKPDEISLRIMVRVSSPRFWERFIMPYSCMTVVKVDGNRFSQTMIDNAEEIIETDITAPRLKWGVFYEDHQVSIDGSSFQIGDWVKVKMDFPIGTVELSAQVEEERPEI